MRNIKIKVEANLYGGTFTCQLDQKSYQTNLAGKVAVTDFRLSLAEEGDGFLPEGGFNVLQWDDFPSIQEIVDPYYLNDDLPRLQKRKVEYPPVFSDDPDADFLKELSRLK